MNPIETEPFDPEHAIKIAADSLAQLRKIDVERVIEWAADETRQELADYIIAGRPDLADEVYEVMELVH